MQADRVVSLVGGIILLTAGIVISIISGSGACPSGGVCSMAVVLSQVSGIGFIAYSSLDWWLGQ